MSDLISKSVLIKVLKDRATNEAIMGYITAYDVTNSIIDEVEEQPTAYDIDKVVEELEEKDSDCEDFGTCNYCQRYWCPRILIYRGDAIEIVKKGGISCDVCEWKLDGDNLMTGCGDYFNLYDNCTEKFKYCPVCGKKIKVVE